MNSSESRYKEGEMAKSQCNSQVHVTTGVPENAVD